jgi:putative oxidoreductase
MLIGWRVAAVHELDIVTFPLLAAFVAFLVQFMDCVRVDRASENPAMSVADWHLAFLRMYVGFDLVPHFTEKLFAGSSSFDADVAAFASFGLPAPVFFVILGGLCEFGIMIGFGLGLFTRLAGLGATLYYLIATISGGHFTKGFIWADPGGGWEYPVLMMVIFLSFSFAGSGRFSLDGVLIGARRMPAALMPLSVRRADRPARD